MTGSSSRPRAASCPTSCSAGLSDLLRTVVLGRVAAWRGCRAVASCRPCRHGHRHDATTLATRQITAGLRATWGYRPDGRRWLADHESLKREAARRWDLDVGELQASTTGSSPVRD